MNDDILQYQIALTKLKGIGILTAKNMIAYLGGVEAIFNSNQRQLLAIPGIGKITIANMNIKAALEEAKQEIEFIEKHNITTYFYTDKNYPYRLKECSDAPLLLYYRGNVDLNSQRIVSVVGTRNISEYGKEITNRIVEELAKLEPNILIVSGLAYGVDLQAHKSAIANQLPNIGVVAHGLDNIYPATHRNIAQQIVENGGILTEYPQNTRPDKYNFVQRNRIIAGLCDATIVVESAERGGSLITATIANDYNRDVFAIPGRTNDTFSKGCNALIKGNKAALIESAEDVIEAMNWDITAGNKQVAVQASIFDKLNDVEERIVKLLQNNKEGIQVNDITLQLALPYHKISATLLNLEFLGRVRCLPGGVYRLQM